MLPENPLDGPCEASQLVDIEDGHLSDLVIRLLEKCYLCSLQVLLPEDVCDLHRP